MPSVASVGQLLNWKFLDFKHRARTSTHIFTIKVGIRYIGLLLGHITCSRSGSPPRSHCHSDTIVLLQGCCRRRRKRGSEGTPKKVRMEDLPRQNGNTHTYNIVVLLSCHPRCRKRGREGTPKKVHKEDRGKNGHTWTHTTKFASTMFYDTINTK